MPENIEVLVVDSSGATQQRVRLPSDVPLQRWLGQMVTKLKLPTQDQSGQPRIYEVRHKESKSVVSPEETLADAGVDENDTLQLVAKGVAGRGRVSPRIRRLREDYRKVTNLVADSELLELLEVRGDPPSGYVIDIQCRTIEGLSRGKPSYRDSVSIDITLPAGYPRAQGGETPAVRVVDGSVWHPNIFANGTVCYGDWQAGKPLSDLIIEVVEILQYKNIAEDDPANIPAAEWAEKNQKLFPTDESAVLTGDYVRVLGEDQGDLVQIV